MKDKKTIYSVSLNEINLSWNFQCGHIQCWSGGHNVKLISAKSQAISALPEEKLAKW